MADDSGNTPVLMQALAFVDKAKDRSTEHPNLFDEFLDATTEYRSAMLDASGKPKGPEFDWKQHETEFIAKMEAIFRDEPDLFEEWRSIFFPNTAAI